MTMTSKIFEGVRVMSDSILYNMHKRCFEKQLNVVLNIIVQTEAGLPNGPCRVFDALKKNFDIVKQVYETNPEYAKKGKQGWRNLTDLMVKSTKDLRLECNYFPNDTVHAMAIEDSVRQLKKDWKNMPDVYKARLNIEGVMLEGYDDVSCKSVVYGISKSSRPSHIVRNIVTEHIKATPKNKLKLICLN